MQYTNNARIVFKCYKISPMKNLILSLLLITSLAQAQQLDIEKLKGIIPRAVGPAGMSGRITAVDVINNNPNVIYIGAASGGVWKSESQGIDWKPVFDKENLQGIGAITIQQSNPDVIWVGTGEGNPRNSLNGGFGIYKSLDGGENWQLMGLEKTRNIHRIIVDRDNPNTVYVAAIGSPWGEHPERGVYKTTDGGKTWKKVTDKEGIPKGELGRIGLAISASNSNRVYALIESEKMKLGEVYYMGYQTKKSTWMAVAEIII